MNFILDGVKHDLSINFKTLPYPNIGDEIELKNNQTYRITRRIFNEDNYKSLDVTFIGESI